MVEVYEMKIEELKQREVELKEKSSKLLTTNKNFEHATEAVFGVLENPYKCWSEGDLQTKKLLLKVVFSESLAFNTELGFGTPKLCLPLRVFELSMIDNSQLVEMGGFEPPCK
jgi:hypothetical protein